MFSIFYIFLFTVCRSRWLPLLHLLVSRMPGMTKRGCDLGNCILSIFSWRQIYVFMYVQKDKYVFTRLPQGNRFFQRNRLKQMERSFWHIWTVNLKDHVYIFVHMCCHVSSSWQPCPLMIKCHYKQSNVGDWFLLSSQDKLSLTIQCWWW